MMKKAVFKHSTHPSPILTRVLLGLFSFALTMTVSGLVMANPCTVREITPCRQCIDHRCPKCSDEDSAWARLQNANAQSRSSSTCGSPRSDSGDERFAPQLGMQFSIGQNSPNVTLVQTPLQGSGAQSAKLSLGLYFGSRYDAGNNGFVRHMGMWSMNLDLFLEKQDEEIWKLRDVAGTGSMWIGPWWAESLGLGSEITEIQSTDYSWLYDLEIGTESNSFGPNIILRKRYAEVDTGMEPSSGSCGQSGCSSSLAATIMPPVQASIGSEGFVFEPVDIENDSEIDFCRLKQIVGADGKALTLYYDAETNNMITSVVDAVSNEYRFAYNELDLLTNVLDVTANRSASFSYTNNGSYHYVSEVTDMGGQVNKYSYEVNPSNTNYLRICAVLRPNMTGFDTTTISYLGTTNTTVTLPEGHTFGLRQTEGGAKIYDERNGLGAWTADFIEGWAYSWHYKSTYGTQTNSIGPNGETYLMDWWDHDEWANPIDQMIKDETLPDGTKRHYEWYPNGRLAQITARDASDNIINIRTNQTTFFDDTWRPSEKLAEYRDASENVLSKRLESYTKFEGPTTNTLDDRYALTSVKTWTSEDTYQETKYVFNTNTFLLEEVQELVSGTNDYQTVQRYGYDSYDRVAWAWQAGQSTNFYGYDSFNRLASMTQTNSGLAVTTSYYYDSLDRLTNVVYPDNTFETWTQAPCGCGWLTHTDRGGNVSSNYFNANKWIWKTTTVSPNGTLLAYQEQYFDNAHNPTSTVDALGFTTYQYFDSSSRLTNSVDALGRSTQYLFDSAGRQYLTIMPDGTMSSNVYDSASRVIQTVKLSPAAETLASEYYVHDSAGRVMITTNVSGLVTSNAYDLAGRVWRTHNIGRGIYSETQYNTEGQVVLQIGPVENDATEAERAAATVSNSYDEVNRLVSVTDPEGRSIAYVYDENWPGRVKYTLNTLGHTNQVNYYCPMTGRLLTNEIVDGPRTVYFYDNAGQVTNTLFADGSSSINVFDGTRLIQTVSRTGLTNSFGFDLAGRQISITNSLGSVTAYSHDSAGNVTSVTSRAESASPLTTSYELDSMNRIIHTVLPDGRATTNTYTDLGYLESRTGAGAVPVSYEYEPGGKMTKLIDGQTNETEFVYDCCNLSRKEYADNSGYDYAYAPRNWLEIRVDPKSAITAYSYNNVGQLTNVDYASDTDVVYFYDSLGRTTSRVDTAGTWVWTYDEDSFRVLSETLLSGGSTVSTVSYTYHPDTYELASVSLDTNHKTEYKWNQGRLTNVTWQAGSASGTVNYEYKEASDLLWKTTYGTGEVVVTRLYDDLNRLTNISTVANGQSVNSFAYTLDTTGRRTAREDADGSRLDWGYDIYDQLTSASRTNSPNGAADAAYKFGYAYDLVGNHLQESRGQLDLAGVFNSLNQITSRDWSGKLDVWGIVETTNVWWTNTVNGEVCAQFDGSNYLGGAELAAGSNTVEIVFWDAAGTNEESRAVFAPPNKPQSLLWDANGNLTNDGYRVYSWDEENRLAVIETAPASVSNGVTKLKSMFAYDGQSRRTLRTDYSGWSGGAYASTNETRFVWDGWLLLAELGDSTTNYYVSGLDLSESMQGAGGIGGMLALAKDDSAYVPCFDGNGNISDYLNSDGVSVAHREFDPFGRTVAATGDQQADFSFWFSSKQEEAAWGLYYYGYRFYQPETGRWASRDPANELSNPILRLVSSTIGTLVSSRQRLLTEYQTASNDPANTFDYLGLDDCPKGCKKHIGPITVDSFDEWRQVGKTKIPGGKCHEVVKVIEGVEVVCQRCPAYVVYLRYTGLRTFTQIACYDRWTSDTIEVPCKCFHSFEEWRVINETLDRDHPKVEEGEADFDCTIPSV